MGKVLSPQQMQALLARPQSASRDVAQGAVQGAADGAVQATAFRPQRQGEIIPPTARELLELTEQALGDVAGMVPLSANQRVALSQAFEARLGEALTQRDEEGAS